MIRSEANQPQDCSPSARLRSRTKHVWCSLKEQNHHEPEIAVTVIKVYLKEIYTRLNEAAGIAKCADACAYAGVIPVAFGRTAHGTAHGRATLCVGRRRNTEDVLCQKPY